MSEEYRLSNVYDFNPNFEIHSYGRDYSNHNGYSSRTNGDYDNDEKKNTNDECESQELFPERSSVMSQECDAYSSESSTNGNNYLEEQCF